MLQWLSQKILKLIGWKTVYAKPTSPHGIIIVYPHTSNWDFPLGVLWKFAVKMQPRWVAKHTWFRFPVGIVMRALGGIGIRRDGNLDITKQLRDIMLAEKECWLCIAPEGTRTHKDYIHMGYYHIAAAAQVPIGIGFIDYKTKTISVGEYRMVKPTVDEELAQLAIDFAGIQAYAPEKASTLQAKPKSPSPKF